MLVKTEIGRLRSLSERTSAAKRLLHSGKVKDLTGTAEAFRGFGFDVTALTLPRFPMRGRERFEIRGFNEIEKFVRQITPIWQAVCSKIQSLQYMFNPLNNGFI